MAKKIAGVTGVLVTSATTIAGETMSKILGILAVVLLVCGTAIARPQMADTTGPPSLAEVSGSEIGVKVDQLALFMSPSKVAITSVGDSNISLWIHNVALFMGEGEDTALTIWLQRKVAITSVGDSNIGVQVDQLALFMGEVDETLPARGAFDSAFSICFKQASLAIFMGEVETTQPMPGAVFDSALVVLLRSQALAFIHTGEGAEVDQIIKGPRTLAVIHQPRTVLHC